MARRGAEFTFDAESYAEVVKQLTRPVTTELTIYAPAFDHALKDPTPDAIRITTERIVIIEGLYVILGTERWRGAAELLDERWVIDVDPELAAKRVVKRHVSTGVTQDADEAFERATKSDMPSTFFILTVSGTATLVFDGQTDVCFPLCPCVADGEFVLENSLPLTRRILSVEDEAISTLSR